VYDRLTARRILKRNAADWNPPVNNLSENLTTPVARHITFISRKKTTIDDRRNQALSEHTRTQHRKMVYDLRCSEILCTIVMEIGMCLVFLIDSSRAMFNLVQGRQRIGWLRMLLLASEVNEQLTGALLKAHQLQPIFLFTCRFGRCDCIYEKISSISSRLVTFAFFLRPFSFDSSAGVGGFGGAKGAPSLFTITAWRDEGPTTEVGVTKSATADVQTLKNNLKKKKDKSAIGVLKGEGVKFVVHTRLSYSDHRCESCIVCR
jgi:hypothetical protein